MLIAEIIRSCSDEGVAAAAVASVGGLFAAAVRAEAEREGTTAGALASALVGDFARDAAERDWRALSVAMAGADHPVLSGLQAMVEHGLRGRERATRVRPPRDAELAARAGRPTDLVLFRCTA